MPLALIGAGTMTSNLPSQSFPWYPLNSKPVPIHLTSLRMGGAAIMMSNKPSLARVAKYQLVQAVRTHHGANSDSYG